MQGFAGDQVTAGEVGDGQRIAIAAIGEHELALVVRAPQLIGLDRARECGALSPVASAGNSSEGPASALRFHLRAWSSPRDFGRLVCFPSD